MKKGLMKVVALAAASVMAVAALAGWYKRSIPTV